MPERHTEPLPIPDEDVERERDVAFRVRLPTYGTKAQALELAARAEHELQVVLHRPDLRVTHVQVDADAQRFHDDLPREPEEFGVKG
jgi:hypothetical protein